MAGNSLIYEKVYRYETLFWNRNNTTYTLRRGSGNTIFLIESNDPSVHLPMRILPVPGSSSGRLDPIPKDGPIEVYVQFWHDSEKKWKYAQAFTGITSGIQLTDETVKSVICRWHHCAPDWPKLGSAVLIGSYRSTSDDTPYYWTASSGVRRMTVTKDADDASAVTLHCDPDDENKPVCGADCYDRNGQYSLFNAYCVDVDDPDLKLRNIKHRCNQARLLQPGGAFEECDLVMKHLIEREGRDGETAQYINEELCVGDEASAACLTYCQNFPGGIRYAWLHPSCNQCIVDDDCNPGEECDGNGRCVPIPVTGCNPGDPDSCGSGRVCDPSTRECVLCYNDAHCGPGQRCVDNQCISSDPTEPPPPDPKPDPTDPPTQPQTGLSTTAIIGIVVGGVVLIIILVVAYWYYSRRRAVSAK